MKNFKKLSIISIVLLMVTLFSNKLFANTTESEIRSGMEDLGWTYSQTRQVNLIEDQSCTWWYREFYADREYKIVAFSEDDDVNEISLTVQYPHGTSFLYDSDDTAAVGFYCNSDQQLRISIANSSSNTPSYASMCKFMIFYRAM